MEWLIAIVLLAVGLVLIVKGGDEFVDAATWMAEVSGIPKFVIGATVVSVATTLPELLVSAMATAEGKTDMAIGNAVGSVTANIGLIMGIALLFVPMAIRRRDYLLKSVLMLGAAGLIVVFGSGMGAFGLVAGVVFLVLFALSTGDSIVAARRGMKESAADADTRPAVNKKTVTVNVLKFVLGAAAIVIGARLLVDNGSELARLCGVPERIISVTMIAIGTSLPELVTTVTAIVKKQGALSVGNIIGANIIDLTLILPICALIAGGSLTATPQVAALDLPAALVVGSVALIPTLITQKFQRWQGVALLVLYAAYVVLTTTVIA